MGKSEVYESNKTTNNIHTTSGRGLSAKVLKWIAMITMFIDHTGVAIVFPVYYSGFFTDFPLDRLYEAMRIIGRLAFPLFIYLIVDSFFYTRNRKRFVTGLLVFALISELPFDAAITFPLPMSEQYETLTLRDLFIHQNVYFTLLIGTLCLTFSEYVFHGAPAFISEKESRNKLNQKGNDVPKHSMVFNLLMVALITAIGCGLAYLLHVDYGIFGILAIVLAYLIHKTGRKKLEIFGIILALVFSNIIELFAALDGLLICASNGKRGNIRHKWLYYIYYPAHLAVLAMIKLIIFHHAGALY